MSTVRDLFGNDVPEPRGKVRKTTGYAAKPGTGPAGETCKTCDHYCILNGRYRKCEVIQWRWTHGPGTDIKAGSPACAHWQPQGEGHE